MAEKLPDEIRRVSTEKKFPDGESYAGIGARDVETIARSSEASLREVEIAALEHRIIPQRYIRNMKTLSSADQAALLKSTVSVVGLGGLGGAVVEILARVGIGTLRLMDGDRFEESNLNRQFLSTGELLGTSKAEAAASRVREVNGATAIHPFAEFLDSQNAARLLEGSHVAVDCLDSLKTRFILEDACKKMGIPLVSAAVAGLCGQVTVVYPEDPGLRLIFGDESRERTRGAEASLGTLPQCVTLISSLECSEVVKILLNRGSVLRNRLMVVDILENSFDVFRLQ